MSNIYFPDQEITFNDLYLVCYVQTEAFYNGGF